MPNDTSKPANVDFQTYPLTQDQFLMNSLIVFYYMGESVDDAPSGVVDQKFAVYGMKGSSIIDARVQLMAGCA